jgi:hypothetical protein
VSLGAALVALLVAAVALALIGRLGGDRAAVRAGPWPGLTARGAALVLAHGLLLAALFGLLAALGLGLGPATAVAYLGVASAGAAAVLVLAARLTRLPGAAVAAAVAFALPAIGLGLVRGDSPPPELIAPAMTFELALWVRRDDLGGLATVWPARARQRLWRRRSRAPRSFSPGRAALAGAAFGLVLSVLGPPMAVLLGASPTLPPRDTTLLAVGLSLLAGAGAGYAAAALSPPTPARPRTGS